MPTDAAHKSWWQTSEVVFGFAFLAAVVLQLVAPLPLARGLLMSTIIAGGAALVIAGATLIIFARREFAHYGQRTDPGHPTTNIVTTGVFSISRNPIYLGAVCVMTGVALVINLLWVLALILPALVACHYILIAPEEKYLAAKFGEEYLIYAASVHRWLGRAWRLK